MAKMLRWERAWGYFLQAFYTGRVHGGGYWKAKRPDHVQHYWKLVRLLKALGISVWLHKDLGESIDAFNRPFTIGGCWNSYGFKVSLLYRSYSILSHEAAHAADYLLNGTRRTSECELVASGAGYLLDCAHMGIRSPGPAVSYAKRQGATSEELSRLEEYILRVFNEMNTLLSDQ